MSAACLQQEPAAAPQTCEKSRQDGQPDLWRRSYRQDMPLNCGTDTRGSRFVLSGQHRQHVYVGFGGPSQVCPQGVCIL